MPLDDETLQVRIKRLPSGEPPLKPHQRWALLCTGGLVLGLVLYCASLLGARPEGPAPVTVALTPAPPNVRERPTAVPTAADGTPLIDLVCGTPVDDTAPYRTDFYGKTFHFAHAECLERFRAKPEAYVKVKVNVNVKMLPDEPVPEGTASEPEELSVPAEPPAAEPADTPQEATVPPADPPAAAEPTVPQPNPDGSVWKDASEQPVPQDDGSEPGWLPPDPGQPAAPPPPAPANSTDDVPGWVP